MSRYISENTKMKATLRYNGVCEECGIKTPIENTEYDHYIPYSVGKDKMDLSDLNGIENIRLICTECNRKKGNKMKRMAELAPNNGLRDHQKDMITAILKYPFIAEESKYGILKGQKMAAVLYGCTASGKTWVSACLPFMLLNPEEDKKCIILTHNKATANRYAEEWDIIRDEVLVGKNLPKKLPIISGGANKTDITFIDRSPVVVFTVQKMSNVFQDEELFKIFKGKVSTVIIDEGHHYGADNTWEKTFSILDPEKIVYLTATPIRHDKGLLPYVPYEKVYENGITTHRLIDVSEITGIKGAKYTRANGVYDKVLKTMERESLVPVDAITIEMKEKDGDKLIFNKISEAENHCFSSSNNDRWDLFEDEKVIEGTMMIALNEHNQTVIDYPAIIKNGSKITSMCVAKNKKHAAQILRVAKRVGWKPVVYYSEEKDGNMDSDVPKKMKDNLIKFEDKKSEINLIIQVDRLTEGYDNPSICHVIWLSNTDSFPRVEQINGRCTRIYKEIAYKDIPKMKIIFPNTRNLRYMMEQYVNMEFDMIQVKLDKELQESIDKFEKEHVEYNYLEVDNAVWVHNGKTLEDVKKDSKRERVTSFLNNDDFYKKLNDDMKEDYIGKILSGDLKIKGCEFIEETTFVDRCIDSEELKDAFKCKTDYLKNWAIRNLANNNISQKDAEYFKLLSGYYSRIFNQTKKTIHPSLRSVRDMSLNQSDTLQQLEEFLEGTTDDEYKNMMIDIHNKDSMIGGPLSSRERLEEFMKSKKPKRKVAK